MNTKSTYQNPDILTLNTPAYPMLSRVIRYGDRATLIVVISILSLGLGWSWNISNQWLAIATLFFAFIIYVFIRVAVELVRLVCDMLLPK